MLLGHNWNHVHHADWIFKPSGCRLVQKEPESKSEDVRNHKILSIGHFVHVEDFSYKISRETKPTSPPQQPHHFHYFLTSLFNHGEHHAFSKVLELNLLFSGLMETTSHRVCGTPKSHYNFQKQPHIFLNHKGKLEMLSLSASENTTRQTFCIHGINLRGFFSDFAVLRSADYSPANFASVIALRNITWSDDLHTKYASHRSCRVPYHYEIYSETARSIPSVVGIADGVVLYYRNCRLFKHSFQLRAHDQNGTQSRPQGLTLVFTAAWPFSSQIHHHLILPLSQSNGCHCIAIDRHHYGKSDWDGPGEHDIDYDTFAEN